MTPNPPSEAQEPGAQEAGSSEVEASRAPFMEHLEELRSRLIRALLGLIACASLCFVFREVLFDFLTDPLYEGLARNGFPTETGFRSPQGAFVFHLKVAVLAGLFLAAPIMLYQVWAFVAPGLYKHERTLAIPFVLLTTICFVGGGAFAYWNVLPEVFDWLLSFSITGGDRKLVPDIAMEDFLGVTTKLLLAFGLAFELPVALGFFSLVGLITHRGLIKFGRYFVVLAFVISALLTPPDPYSQAMLAVPLIGLYGLSIGISWAITRSRERKEAEAEADEEGEDSEEATSEAED